MGKIIEVKIDRFDGGISNDVRSTDGSKYQVTKHFDPLSYTHRLVPYRSSESGQDTIGRKIKSFLYVSGKLFGLGVVSGTTRRAVYYKDTFTDGSWSTTANNESGGSSGTSIWDSFIHYKGFLYGVHGSQSVFKYDITGSASWVEADLSLSGTVTSFGGSLVHSKDDVLYVAYNTSAGGIIAKKDGANWTDSALVLPTSFTITSISEYGNYLAIACKPTNINSGNSRVFLWDRDSSVTTLAESIDWGAGELNIIEELEGRLIGISIEKRETSNNLFFKTALSFKYYAGAQGAIEFERINGSDSIAITPLSILGTQKQKANGRIYFLSMLTTQEGITSTEGVWSVGHGSAAPQLVVNCEYRSSDGTVPNSLDGFFLIGGYMFVAYNGDGTMSKTSDTGVYTTSSTYESLFFNCGDNSLKKDLVGVTVNTLPLPSGGTVVLKYKKDEDTAWTTIFTHSTTNSISHSAVNIESTGVTLPEFNEIQFQINSTGGATITGLSFKAEITNKRLY